MTTQRDKKYRKRHSLSFHTIHNSKPKPVLGIITLLIPLPVLIYGCSAHEPSAYLHQDGHGTVISKAIMNIDETTWVDTLDIFVFNDDELQRLDSYQRDNAVSGTVGVSSRSGAKIIYFCANGQRSRYEWSDINSRSALDRLHVSLEKEDRDTPVMTAEHHVDAGADLSIDIGLCPVASEVMLRSISCDFSGRPYQDEELKEVKAYLTNVSAQCSITASGEIMPTRIINAGGLNENDVKGFKDRSLIVQDVAPTVGKEGCRPDIRLRCYPNCSTEDTPGSPFTRLVIEGKIAGNIYYYPINIAGSLGLKRNCRYIFDLKIRMKGTTDPDIPAESEIIELKIENAQWEEKEPYTIGF